MRTWRAGDLMCVAAGISVILGAFLPFAHVGGASFSGLQLRMYEPIVFAVLTGGVLVAFGLRRTLWAGMVGLLSSVAVGVIVLMVHEDVYAGLGRAGVTLVSDAAHVSGYGEYALFAAGLLAAAAGVVTVVQREPPVSTRPSRPLPDEGFTLG